MQIVFIQIGFAKFNKFAPALAENKEKETNDQKKKKKVVINSTFEMMYEKNEGACKKKNTFIYQMDFRQNKVLECCNNSSLPSGVLSCFGEFLSTNGWKLLVLRLQTPSAGIDI